MGSNGRSSRSVVAATRPEKKRIDLDALAKRGSASSSKSRAGSRSTGYTADSAADGKAARGNGRAGATLDATLDPNSPWCVRESKYPRTGTRAAKIKFCVNYAVLAPSSHNSQPWKFKVGSDFVELWADRSRALPVADPHDRELTISCGAALHHLRLALRRYYMLDAVTLCPDASQHDLLARVSVGESDHAGSPEDEALLRAIPERRTTRKGFEADRRPPPGVLGAMAKLAHAEGATLTFIDGKRDRLILAKLVGEADEIQFGSAAFRRELAMWMHHNRTHSPDGVPGYALNMKELASIVAPLIVRTFDVGHGTAARDEELALHSPVLAVLSTPGDRDADWLRAGQALSAVLLRAAQDGVTASYLNQPLEVEALRPRVARLTLSDEHPQLILRFGYAAEMPRHTPRRPAASVLL